MVYFGKNLAQEDRNDDGVREGVLDSGIRVIRTISGVEIVGRPLTYACSVHIRIHSEVAHAHLMQALSELEPPAVISDAIDQQRPAFRACLKIS